MEAPSRWFGFERRTPMMRACTGSARRSCYLRAPGFRQFRRAEPRHCSLQFTDRNIESDGIHHALTLKLYPQTIDHRARKDHIELHPRPNLGQERMVVDHVDK